MKKLLALVMVIVITISTSAQDTPETSQDKNVLKINTLSLILGTGSIFYEHGFSDKISGQLGLGYMNFKLADTKFTGLILTPEVRIYPKANAIDGFYVAPYFRYQKFSVENTDAASEGSLTSMGGGAVFGRQWIANSGFVMDLFFGGHYGDTDVSVESGTNSFDENFFKGFKMRMGFALGFSF